VRNVIQRLHRRLHRELGDVVCRRLVAMRNNQPVISFTFDDFPRSAAQAGAEILERHGVRATYYASLGLMGKRDTPVGEIFTEQDLAALLAAGHELGCHTFRHSDAWASGSDEFECSIVENRVAMHNLFPEVSLRTLSFPYNHPRLRIKRTAARHFQCCRSGGQTFNDRVADLNLLRCFFLEQSAGHIDPVTEMIAHNRARRGWLILTTHDVRIKPSRFGCTPKFFEAVVREAVASGARILPISPARETVESSAA